LDKISEAQEIRAKIDKWSYIKLKRFFTSKKIINRVKRLPTEWEKILANYTSDKELISRIYMNIKKFTCNDLNNPIKCRQQTEIDISQNGQ
jgi:hypothetical protein